MARETLSLKQRTQLVDWLRFPGRAASKIPSELAEEAEKELGFSVKWQQIVYICKELEIPYITNKTKPSPQEVAGVKQNLLALDHRVKDLESTIEKLQAELKLFKGFYVNTSKKPKQAELPLDQH